MYHNVNGVTHKNDTKCYGNSDRNQHTARERVRQTELWVVAPWRLLKSHEIYTFIDELCCSAKCSIFILLWYKCIGLWLAVVSRTESRPSGNESFFEMKSLNFIWTFKYYKLDNGHIEIKCYHDINQWNGKVDGKYDKRLYLYTLFLTHTRARTLGSRWDRKRVLYMWIKEIKMYHTAYNAERKAKKEKQSLLLKSFRVSTAATEMQFKFYIFRQMVYVS